MDAPPVAVGDLPIARNGTRPVAGSTVFIDETRIYLDGSLVVDATDTVRAGFWLIPELEQRLVRSIELRRKWKTALCRVLPASLCAHVMSNADLEARRLRLAASPNTSYIVVKKVLFLAHRVGYRRVSLLAADPNGQVRGFDSKTPECVKWKARPSSCLDSCEEWGPT